MACSAPRRGTFYGEHGAAGLDAFSSASPPYRVSKHISAVGAAPGAGQGWTKADVRNAARRWGEAAGMAADISTDMQILGASCALGDSAQQRASTRRH